MTFRNLLNCAREVGAQLASGVDIAGRQPAGVSEHPCPSDHHDMSSRPERCQLPAQLVEKLLQLSTIFDPLAIAIRPLFGTRRTVTRRYCDA
jgi:hypothetical protein